MEFLAPPWYNPSSMFTGIINELGRVDSLIRFKDRVVLTVSVKFSSELKAGDSVSVNGVCLTVTEALRSSFKADVVSETLSRSSLQYLKSGEFVNLERAVPADGRLEGHIVQGHVDCKSMITNIVSTGSSREIEIRVPEGYRRYVAAKGSVAVDGISLTVASVNDRYFKVVIVPHTALKTNLFHKKIGDRVNLEFDIIAKYVEKLVENRGFGGVVSMKDIRIDTEFLKKAGFLN